MRRLLIILLLLSVIHPLYARQYTTGDRLPSNIVYQCFRDSKGYLWFGTDAGAVRFDGRNFRTYTLQDGLEDNDVFKFYEDRKGRIWVMTHGGGPCYIHNDSCYNALQDKTLQAIKSTGFRRINHILETDDSTMYLGYKMGDVLRVQNGTPEILYRSPPRAMYTGTLDLILPVPGGVQTIYRRAVITFKDKNAPVIKYLHDIAVFFFQDNYFYVGDAYEGLKIYRDSVCIQAYQDPRLLEASLLHVYCNKRGELFCGTRNGLIIIDQKTGKKKEFFPEQSVSCITQDIYGNYWITTAGHGIYCLNEEFYNMRLLYDKKGWVFNGLNHQVFFSDRDTLRGYSGKDAMVYRYPSGFHFEMQPLFCSESFWLCKNNKGQGWLADRNGQQLIVGDAMEYFKYAFAGPPDIFLMILYKQTGVALHHGVYKSGKIITSDSFLFTGKPVIRYNKEQERLYVFTARGTLLSYDPLLRRWQQLDSLPGTQIMDLLFIGDKLAVPLEDGTMVVYHQQPPYMPRRVSPGMAVYGAWNTNDGRCVIKSSKGFQVSAAGRGQSLLPSFLRIEYPFHNTEINDIYPVNDSLVCNIDGQLYLFHQSLLNKKLHRPPLIIEEIMVNEKRYRDRNIYISESSSANVRIRLGTFYFNQPDHCYAYRLYNGEDTSAWYTISDGNSIDLLLNRFGACIIAIKAISENGIASATAHITITLKAPFYYDTWFYLLCLGLAVAVIWCCIWLYNRRRQHRFRQELDYLQLEYRSINSLLNPHFIFNAINNIQSLVNEQKGEKANEYLHLLSRLIRQNIENLQFTLIPLDKELNLVSNYIYLQNLRFGNSISFVINDHLADTSFIHIPPLLIHTFIENAILHGYRPEIPDFRITLDLELSTDDYLIVSITDNGRGYTPGQQAEHLADKTSLGIAAIRKRLERLSKFYHLHYSLDISDLGSRGSRGTAVVLTLYARLAERISSGSGSNTDISR